MRLRTAVALLFTTLPAALAEAAAPAAAACEALAKLSFQLYPDTVAMVESAASVASSATAPAHCRVRGYVSPQVGFEVRLPAAWNGRLLQQGCRGMCGIIHLDTANDALARGYATVGTDMGHRAVSSTSGAWALSGPSSLVDFGFRGTHVTTLAARSLVERYYSRPVAKSYFRGCGTGGRQALVAAQRYPDDFDGILTDGGVVFAYARLNYALAHFVRANVRPDGGQWLSAGDAERVHRAALAACDASDGLEDGTISDPQHCTFDPGQMECGRAAPSGCLSPQQVDAVRRFYRGPVDARGRSIYPGQPVGSELAWPDAFFGERPKYEAFPAEILRYVLFQHPPGPGFQQREFDLSVPPEFFEPVESLMTADDPQLDRFRERGGKLLMVHGTNEPAMPFAYAVDYFERVARMHGGTEASSEFFRLFLVPGELHCASGIPHGAQVDGLTALESWVERSEAPARLLAYRVRAEPAYPERVRFPIPAENVSEARPYFPYPATTRYRGHGDPSRPESFIRAERPASR